MEQLEVLITCFIRPFKMAASSKNPPCSHEDLNSIFLNSETVLFLHQIFLKGLTARMESWPTLVLGTSLGGTQTSALVLGGRERETSPPLLRFSKDLLSFSKRFLSLFVTLFVLLIQFMIIFLSKGICSTCYCLCCLSIKNMSGKPAEGFLLTSN